MEQPITHTLLRNSQIRNRESLNNSQKIVSSQLINPVKQKYHFNYSNKITNFNSNQQISQQFQSNQRLNRLIENEIDNRENIKHSTKNKQTLIICTSLPHQTRPKYSSTFKQMNKLKPHTTTTNNNYINLINQLQQQQQNKAILNLKSNIDLCLYNLTDKLKQIRQKECLQHENVHARPSINQLRANRYLTDKNIYRIQPSLVQKYVSAVYKQYEIPDPFISTQNVQNSNQFQKVTFNVPGKYFTSQQNHKQQYSRPQSIILNNQQLQYNHIQNISNSNSFKPNNKLEYSTRRNTHLLQKQKRRNKKAKKIFLNITLSKQKNIIEGKDYKSPLKQNKTQIKKQQRQNQKSRSNSSNKIKKLKQNISKCKNSENYHCIQAQKYNYLQSPYQIISNRNNFNANVNVNANKKGQILNVPNISSYRNDSYSEESNGKINILVRPFDELMKVSVPLQSPFHPNNINDSICLNPNTTLNSLNRTNLTNILQSKYHPHSTFISQQGEILQQFRFCILCQQAILSANIQKHEQKCIGWVHQSKYYTFKELYSISNEKQLQRIVHHKIIQIKDRIFNRMKEIQEKDNNNKIQHQKLNKTYSEQANDNILHSIRNYLQNFTQRQAISQNLLLDKTIMQKTPEEIDKSFKQIQKNYSNLFYLLMEDTNKLHWFLKLLQNYTRYLQIMSLNMNTKHINQSKLLNKNPIFYDITKEQYQSSDVMNRTVPAFSNNQVLLDRKVHH